MTQMDLDAFFPIYAAYHLCLVLNLKRLATVLLEKELPHEHVSLLFVAVLSPLTHQS